MQQHAESLLAAASFDLSRAIDADDDDAMLSRWLSPPSHSQLTYSRDTSLGHVLDNGVDSDYFGLAAAAAAAARTASNSHRRTDGSNAGSGNYLTSTSSRDAMVLAPGSASTSIASTPTLTSPSDSRSSSGAVAEVEVSRAVATAALHTSAPQQPHVHWSGEGGGRGSGATAGFSDASVSYTASAAAAGLQGSSTTSTSAVPSRQSPPVDSVYSGSSSLPTFSSIISSSAAIIDRQHQIQRVQWVQKKAFGESPTPPLATNTADDAAAVHASTSTTSFESSHLLSSLLPTGTSAPSSVSHYFAEKDVSGSGGAPPASLLYAPSPRPVSATGDDSDISSAGSSSSSSGIDVTDRQSRPRRAAPRAPDNTQVELPPHLHQRQVEIAPPRAPHHHQSFYPMISSLPELQALSSLPGTGTGASSSWNAAATAVGAAAHSSHSDTDDDEGHNRSSSSTLLSSISSSSGGDGGGGARGGTTAHLQLGSSANRVENHPASIASGDGRGYFSSRGTHQLQLGTAGGTAAGQLQLGYGYGTAAEANADALVASLLRESPPASLPYCTASTQVEVVGAPSSTAQVEAGLPPAHTTSALLRDSHSTTPQQQQHPQQPSQRRHRQQPQSLEAQHPWQLQQGQQQQ